MHVVMREHAPDRPIGFATMAIGAACVLLVLKVAGLVNWSWLWVGLGLGVCAVLIIGLLLLGSFTLPIRNGRYHPQ